MSQFPVSLEDKYRLKIGRVFVTGMQTLVRLPLMQRWRDERAGLKTGGFISGYRGSPTVDDPLEHGIELRERYLTDYQDAAYARRYRALIDRVRQTERDKGKGLTGLTSVVARTYFKLLAYKDEYEVARLKT